MDDGNLWDEEESTSADDTWDVLSALDAMADNNQCQTSSSSVVFDSHQQLLSQQLEQGTSLEHIFQETKENDIGGIPDEDHEVLGRSSSSTTAPSGGVPQQPDPQFVAQHLRKIDITKPVLSNLMKNVEGPLPSSVDGLHAFIHSDLEDKIPIFRDLHAVLFSGNQPQQAENATFSKFRATNENESFRFGNIVAHVANIDWNAWANTGGNPAYLHLVYDAFIHYWMGSLLWFKQVDFVYVPDRKQTCVHPPPISLSDESEDNTSIKRARMSKLTVQEMVQIKSDSPKFRPHSSVSIKGLKLFCGEEANAHRTFKDAENDFKQKLQWNPAVMGRIKYTFGYVACGTQFCLYAIHPRNDEVKLTKLVNRVLNLTVVEDVLELFCCLVQIARILVRFHSEIYVLNVPRIGEVWEIMSDANSRITIHEKWVEKVLVVSEDRPIKWACKGGLKELYDLIEKEQICNTIKLLNSFKTTDEDDNVIQHVLILGPIGYRIEPSKEELYEFMGDILAALFTMHDNHWVHRDVQISNIVKQENGHWMLIDLENAAKLDRDGTAEWPIVDFQIDEWPLHLKDEDRWKPEHDVKQVGLMLEGLVAFSDHPKRAELLDYFKNHATDAQDAMQVWCRVWYGGEVFVENNQEENTDENEIDAS